MVSLLENLNEKINLHFVVDNNNISYKIPEFIKNHRMLNKLEIKVLKTMTFFSQLRQCTCFKSNLLQNVFRELYT